MNERELYVQYSLVSTQVLYKLGMSIEGVFDVQWKIYGEFALNIFTLTCARIFFFFYTWPPRAESLIYDFSSGKKKLKYHIQYLTF